MSSMDFFDGVVWASIAEDIEFNDTIVFNFFQCDAGADSWRKAHGMLFE